MKKTIIFIFCLVFLLLFAYFPALAEGSSADSWELTTEKLSQDAQEEYLTRINFVVGDDVYSCGPISCFAVADNGIIAIGSDMGELKTVHILDTQGHPLYAIRFRVKSSYSLGWCQADHTMIILISRGSRLVCIDPNRNTSVCDMKSTWENNKNVSEEFKNIQTINGRTYRAANPLGIFNFLLLPEHERLSVTDGEVTSIVYNTNTNWLNEKLTQSFFVLTICLATLFFFAYQIKNLTTRDRKKQ